MNSIFRRVFACVLLLTLYSCSPGPEDAKVADPLPVLAGKGFAVFAGDQSVELTWPSIYNASQFTLYWSTQPDLTPATANRIELNTTHYRHNGLTNGLTYYYAVVAYTEYGLSGLSEILSATPQYPELQPPSQFQAFAGDQRVTLDWVKISQAGSYTIFWEKGKTPSVDQSPRIDFVTPPFVHENLQNGVDYHYIVTANIENRTGKATQPQIATPSMAPPFPPSSVSYTRSASAISLNWRVQDADSYNIYWGTASGVNENSSLFANQSNSFNHANINSSATYYYRIAANKRGVMGALSSEFIVPATVTTSETTLNTIGTVPAPPTPGYRVGDRQVTLQWPGVSGALTYNIYWSLSPGVNGNSQALYNVQSPFVHTGLTNNVAVYYRVSAQNLVGESALSQEFSVTPEMLLPGVPQNFQLLAGETWVGATWLAVENAEKYFVYYKRQSDSTYSAMTVATAPVIIENLVANTTYQLFVEAANLDQTPPQNPSPSNKTTVVKQIVTQSPPPSPPTELYAIPENRGVTLNWQGLSGLNYKIYRGLGSQSARELIATTADTVYSDSGLTNGVSYTYSLRSVSAAGESNTSLTVTVTPQVPQPNAPGNVSVVAGDGSIAVNWSPLSNISYNVYAIENKNDTNRTVFSNANPIQIVNGLTNGVEYKVYVTAVQVDGLSSAESSKSAEFLVTPHVPAPSQLTGLFINSNGVVNQLGWDSLAAAAGYRVYWSIDQAVDPATSSFSNVTDNSFQHTPVNLGGGHLVHYAVAAYNSGGEGPLAYFVPSTQPTAQPPIAPSDFSAMIDAQALTANTVVFNWTPTDGSSSYAIYWSNNVNLPLAQWSKLNGAQPNDLQNQLKFGATYYYLIAAINSVGETVSGQPQSVTPQYPVPGTPSGVMVTPGDAQITVLWDQQAGQTYNLYYGLTSTAENVVNNVHPMHVLQGLSNGSNYLLQIAAVNAGNVEGPKTATYTVVPSAVVGPPVVNTAPRFLVASPQSITLNNSVNPPVAQWDIGVIDDQGDALSWSVNPASAVNSNKVSLTSLTSLPSGSSDARRITYQPLAGQIDGNDTFSVIVNDGNGGLATLNFNVNVALSPLPGSSTVSVPGAVTAGTVSTITVATLDSSGNVVIGDRATVQIGVAGANARPALLPVTFSNGVYRASYTPTVAGNDSISVSMSVNGQAAVALSGSPFTSVISPAGLNTVTHTLRTSGSIGANMDFTLTANDAFNNRLSGLAFTATATDAVGGGGQNLTVTEQGNGVYAIAFSPSLATTYSVDVKYNNASVGNFPVNVAVVDPVAGIPVPANSIVSIANSAVAGTPQTINVTVYDANSQLVTTNRAALAIVVNGANANPTPLTTSFNNGIYSASYTPTVAGSDNVSISMSVNGQAAVALSGSPFTVNVAPAVLSSVAHTLNTAGIVNTAMDFTITAGDAYNNRLSGLTFVATASDTVSSASQNLTVTEQGNGVYAIAFTPTQASTYAVDVTLNNASVGAFPINVVVSDPAAGVPAPSRSVVSVSNAVVAGQLSQISVSVFDINGAPVTTNQAALTILVNGANASATPLLASFNNGVYNASYTPTIAGVDSISIAMSVNGQPAVTLNGSPFSSTISPAALSSVTNTLNLAGTINVAMDFTLTASDAFSNRLSGLSFTATATNTTSGASQNLTVTDQGNGVYGVAFIPTSAVVYTVDVKYNNTSVSNFPLNVGVTDPVAGVPVPANSVVSVANNIVAGNPNTISVTVFDANQNPVSTNQATVSMIVGGANANTLPLTTTFSNGVYSASYTPTVAGTDSISITMAVNGQPAVTLPNSPFSTTVSPAALSSLQHTLNTSGSINTAMDFTMTASDAYNNRLTGLAFAATATPSGGTSQNLVVTEQGNGIYAVAFTPVLASTYAVDVKLSGASVGNFPFNVLVSDPAAGIPVPVNSQVSYSNSVVAGNLSNISVSVFDINQTPVTTDLAVVNIVIGGANPQTLTPTFANGAYTALYTPTAAGTDTISISMAVGGQPAVNLTGSPFSSTITPGLLSSVTHTLNTTGSVNTSMNFTLTASDAYANRISGLVFAATATNTSNSTSQNLTVTEQGNGVYAVAFTPTSVTTYAVDVKQNSLSVGIFPVNVVVTDPAAGVPVPANSQVVYAASGVAGTANNIAVTVYDKNQTLVTTDQAVVRIVVGGANANPTVLATTFDAVSGTYRASYTPTVAGTDTLTITMAVNGQAAENLVGSPYSISVSPAALWTLASTLSPSGSINTAMDFTLTARDFYSNLISGLTFAVTANNRTTNITQDLTVTEQGNGVYAVAFTPASAATYSVDVKYNGSSVGNFPFLVTVTDPAAGIPVPANSQVSYSTTVVAGNANNIVVTALDNNLVPVTTNQAAVNIVVSGANAIPTALVTTFNGANGTYSASYTPTVAGTDNIAITMSVNGQTAVALTGSPFSTSVSAAALSSVTNTLNTSGVINTAMDFTITASDAYSNRLSGLTFAATATNTATTISQNLAVTDQGNGVYAIAFTPIAAATYSVDVKNSGTSVGNFPISVLVTDPAAGVPVPANSQVSYSTTVVAGNANNIVVTALDNNRVPVTTNQAAVNIVVSGANAIPTALVTTFNGANGTYSASYTPTVAGTDNIAITMSVNGQPAVALTGSPFSTSVSAAALSSVTNTLNTSGVINTAMDFTITASDAFSNRLSGLTFAATATNTSTTISQNLAVTDQGNGVYAIAFTPTSVANYAVDVKYSNSSVSNFPVSVSVIDPAAGIPVPANSQVSYATSVVAGNANNIIVTAYDKNLVLVTTDQAVVSIIIGGANNNPTALATTFVPSTGSYTASYTPTVAGTDTISISMAVNGQAPANLTGSPFSSAVTPGAYSTATYNLNFSGVIGTAMNLSVFPTDAFSNRLSGLTLAATINDPTGSPIPLTISEVNTSGEYTTSYIPAAIGNYQLNVTYAGSPLTNFPLSVPVTAPLPDPTKSILAIPTTGTAGVASTIIVDARDANSNPVLADQATVAVTISGANPTTGPITATYTSGQYRASYTPLKSGVDTISVSMTVNGQQPYNMGSANSSIAPAAYNSATYTLTFSGIIGSTMSLTVVPMDAYNNALPGLILDASITSPTSSLIPLTLSDVNSNGNYSTSYVPNQLGSYTINVSLAGSALTNFPLAVPVTAPLPDPAQSVVSVPGTASVGSPVLMTVEAHDSTGALVLADQATVQVSIAGANATATPIVASYAAGVYSAQYTPSVSGNDDVSISMTVSGQATQTVGNSPYRIVVSPGVFDHITHTLTTTQGDLYTSFDFSISAFDINNNSISGLSFTAQASIPGTSILQPLPITDQGNGSYNVTFVPAQAGAYSVNVFYNTTTVVPFPIGVNVTDPLPVAANSILNVPATGIVGTPTTVTVSAYDARNNLVTTDHAVVAMAVTGANARNVTATFNAGVYSASYTPSVVGNDNISLSMAVNGLPAQTLGSSPYLSVVSTGGYSSATTTLAASGQVFVPMDYIINATDIGGNPVTGLTPVASVVEPGGDVVALPVTEVGGGAYTVKYTPVISGQHQFNLTINGSTVTGFPALVNVTNPIAIPVDLAGELAAGLYDFYGSSNFNGPDFYYYNLLGQSVGSTATQDDYFWDTTINNWSLQANTTNNTVELGDNGVWGVSPFILSVASVDNANGNLIMEEKDANGVIYARGVFSVIAAESLFGKKLQQYVDPEFQTGVLGNTIFSPGAIRYGFDIKLLRDLYELQCDPVTDLESFTYLPNGIDTCVGVANANNVFYTSYQSMFNIGGAANTGPFFGIYTIFGSFGTQIQAEFLANTPSDTSGTMIYYTINPNTQTRTEIARGPWNLGPASISTNTTVLKYTLPSAVITAINLPVSLASNYFFTLWDSGAPPGTAQAGAVIRRGMILARGGLPYFNAGISLSTYYNSVAAKDMLQNFKPDNGKSILASISDGDGDGVPDSVDKFPNDAARDSDFDNDGIADKVFYLTNNNHRLETENVALSDADDDGDGIPDLQDVCPYDPNNIPGQCGGSIRNGHYLVNSSITLAARTSTSGIFANECNEAVGETKSQYFNIEDRGTYFLINGNLRVPFDPKTNTANLTYMESKKQAIPPSYTGTYTLPFYSYEDTVNVSLTYDPIKFGFYGTVDKVQNAYVDANNILNCHVTETVSLGWKYNQSGTEKYSNKYGLEYPKTVGLEPSRDALELEMQFAPNMTSFEVAYLDKSETRIKPHKNIYSSYDPANGHYAVDVSSYYSVATGDAIFDTICEDTKLYGYFVNDPTPGATVAGSVMMSGEVFNTKRTFTNVNNTNLCLSSSTPVNLNWNHNEYYAKVVQPDVFFAFLTSSNGSAPVTSQAMVGVKNPTILNPDGHLLYLEVIDSNNNAICNRPLADYVDPLNGNLTTGGYYNVTSSTISDSDLVTPILSSALGFQNRPYSRVYCPDDLVNGFLNNITSTTLNFYIKSVGTDGQFYTSDDTIVSSLLNWNAVFTGSTGSFVSAPNAGNMTINGIVPDGKAATVSLYGVFNPYQYLRVTWPQTTDLVDFYRVSIANGGTNYIHDQATSLPVSGMNVPVGSLTEVTDITKNINVMRLTARRIDPGSTPTVEYRARSQPILFRSGLYGSVNWASFSQATTDIIDVAANAQGQVTTCNVRLGTYTCNRINSRLELIKTPRVANGSYAILHLALTDAAGAPILADFNFGDSYSSSVTLTTVPGNYTYPAGIANIQAPIGPLN